MYKQYYDKYKLLGLNINFFRKKKGYTQERLAEILDKEPHHISNIELAKSAPSLDVIFGIADALDVSAVKLFEFRE